MANRETFPREIKNAKLKHLEKKYFRSKTGILLCI